MTSVKDIKTAEQRLKNMTTDDGRYSIFQSSVAWASEVADLRAYAEQLERERDEAAESNAVLRERCNELENGQLALLDRAIAAERERDALKQRLDVSEAQAADLRQALSQRLSPQPVGTVVADERKAFEAWCATRDNAAVRLKRTDQYVVPDVQAAWVAWQGRAASAAQTPAQQSGGDSLLKQFLKAGEDAGITHLNLKHIFTDGAVSHAKPITTIPGGVQALADYTGGTVMYGDHAVIPRGAAPEAHYEKQGEVK